MRRREDFVWPLVPNKVIRLNEIGWLERTINSWRKMILEWALGIIEKAILRETFPEYGALRGCPECPGNDLLLTIRPTYRVEYKTHKDIHGRKWDTGGEVYHQEAFIRYLGMEWKRQCNNSNCKNYGKYISREDNQRDTEK